MAANGLRSALLKVAGFDYVPEGLRSQAFLEAAARVQQAHFGMDNFYNEGAPMQALADLGSSIPRPAFHKCLTATILVRVGNHYGTAWAAQEPAKKVLKGVTTDRWEYFFDGCPPVDDVLLTALQDSRVAERWCSMVAELPRTEGVKPTNKQVRQLVESSRGDDAASVSRRASALVLAMRKSG